MRTRLAALGLALLLGACCRDPWRAYPQSVRPDEQLSNTSGTHGYDMYIWHCLAGRRVVIAYYSSEMACRAAERETTACGGTTVLETRVREAPVGPIRAGREWR